MKFSFFGLLIGAVILLPNLLMIFVPPVGMPQGLSDGQIALTIAENVGRAGVFVILILFSGQRIAAARVDGWLWLLCLCAAVYYGLWIRYAVRGGAFSLLFSPLWGIPVPMAVFPAAVFLFTAVWIRSLPLGIAAGVFGVAHIIISLRTWASIR